MKGTGWNAQGIQAAALVCLAVIAMNAAPAGAEEMQGMSMAPEAAAGTQAEPETAGAGPMKMGGGMEVAHPFFTHMGVPEDVGTYSLRLSSLARKVEGDWKADAAFHFEAGLTDTMGFHLRNNAFFAEPRTEATLQFAALRSNDRMSGISPFIEAEFPTQSVHGEAVDAFIGVSTALENSTAAWNQSIEYDPKNETVEGSAAFVWKVGERFFPVVEVIAEAAKGERPIINQLEGLKYRINDSLLLGVAVETPVTHNKDFTAQFVVQLEMNL